MMAIKSTICIVSIIYTFSAVAKPISPQNFRNDTKKEHTGIQQQARQYKNKAADFYRYNIFDSAAYYSNKAAERFFSLKDTSGAFLSQQYTALVYAKQANAGKALELLQRHLDYFNRTGNNTGIADTYTNIGLVNSLIDNYNESLFCLKKALKYYEKTRDIPVQFYRSAAYTYQKMKNYDEAIENYQKALHIHKKNKDSMNMAYIYSNIGTIYSRQGNFEQADDYYQKALGIIKDTNSYNLAVLYNNLGTLFNRQDKKKEALPYLEKAAKILHEIKNQRLFAVVNNNLGVIYFETGEKERGINILKNVLKISRENGFLSAALTTSGGLLEKYHEMGEIDSSYRYMVLYNTIKDSIFTRETTKRIADFKVFYETRLKEQENELLKAERQVKEKQIFILVCILIGAFLVIVLITLLYRQKAKLNKELVKRNLDITATNEKLDKLVARRPEKAIEIPDNSGCEAESFTQKLKPEHKEHIYNLILDAMENDKVFMDRDISLNKLSAKINKNFTYVSLVINEYFCKSFFNLINEYRVNEARKLLSGSEAKKYTIESVAKMVGFNNQPTFNRVFKKHTGVTPSFFMNSASKIKENYR